MAGVEDACSRRSGWEQIINHGSDSETHTGVSYFEGVIFGLVGGRSILHSNATIEGDEDDNVGAFGASFSRSLSLSQPWRRKVFSFWLGFNRSTSTSTINLFPPTVEPAVATNTRVCCSRRIDIWLHPSGETRCASQAEENPRRLGRQCYFLIISSRRHPPATTTTIRRQPRSRV